MKYHTEQGLGLIIFGILTSLLGNLWGWVGTVGGIICTIGAIKGHCERSQGQREPAPVIGDLVQSVKESIAKRKTSVDKEDTRMKPIVYFSREITPEKVLELYRVLGKELPGKIAVKVHSGEEGNQNFLHPEFWKSVVDAVNGTVVECNTAW